MSGAVKSAGAWVRAERGKEVGGRQGGGAS